eukprot:249310-Chlamydomonas_euryale.AAC.3
MLVCEEGREGEGGERWARRRKGGLVTPSLLRSGGYVIATEEARKKNDRRCNGYMEAICGGGEETERGRLPEGFLMAWRWRFAAVGVKLTEGLGGVNLQWALVV